MFGFQRTGDGLWAAADQMARRFCSVPPPGAPRWSGGLQHNDGHSLLLAGDRHNLVHPDAEPRVPYVTTVVSRSTGVLEAALRCPEMCADIPGW
jgi:pyruvate dehydrogenase complex dehydrogenase (E1) component